MKSPEYLPRSGHLRRFIGLVLCLTVGLGSVGNAAVNAGARTVPDVKVDGDVVRLSEFRVEGRREGQARALNQQRAADNLRSIVSADAAGRYPDQNVAAAGCRRRSSTSGPPASG